MYKPLFFTAVMAVVACFASDEASAGGAPETSRASNPCPDGKTWDAERQKCVRWHLRKTF